MSWMGRIAGFAGAAIDGITGDEPGRGLRRRAGVIGAAVGVATAGAGGGAVTAGAQVAHALPAPGAAAIAADHAGYEGSLSGRGSVAADLRVPSLSCTSHATGRDAVAVGLRGTDEGAPSFVGVQLLLSCTAGDTVAILIGGNQYSTTTVGPDDLIQISVSDSDSGGHEAYTDATTGQSASRGSLGLTLTGYGLDVFGSSTGGGKFPAFSPISFTDADVNGSSLGAAAPQRLNQVDGAGRTQIRTTKLVVGGTAFTDAWVRG
jgi:hypothetical protein